MKFKYLAITLFSLGLICASCGKKKKEGHEAHTEQHVNGEAHDHDGKSESHHEHKAHEGHSHDEHGGHNH